MKIGFVAGAFDLLHPGHIQLLRDCKDMCEYLVVGLHVDPSTERKEKNKPVQTVYERFEQLKACKYVDQVVPYETENDLLNMLNNGVINVRFLGGDYNSRGKEITGEKIVPIEIIPRGHSYSSYELRERIKKS